MSICKNDVLNTLYRGLNAYCRNVQANVAMIFALSLLPLFVVAGFVIDNGRHITEQNRLQTALDITALATARRTMDQNLSEAEMTDVAQKMFVAQYDFAKGVVVNPLDVKIVGEELVLSAKGNLDTTVMSITGVDKMGIGAVSAVVYNVDRPVEIALVLDTSGSMSGSKLTDLKEASKSLVDLVMPSQVPAQNGSVKMSVVPFARYVNVGTSNRYQSWIDVDNDYSTTSQRCTTTNAARLAAGCQRVSRTCTKWRGSIEQGNRESYQGTCYSWQCPEGAEPEQTCTPRTTDYSWYGCVASRSYPLNIEDRSYMSSPVWGFVATNGNQCPSVIQPLTNSHQKVDIAIDSLVARNDTYIATGLTWGYRTLSPTGPFTEAEDYQVMADADGRKVMILMSDGANTRSPSNNGKHNSRNETVANTYTAEVCEEAKDQGIEVYTIAFDLDDLDTKQMLETCATSTDYYFDASDAAQLKQAFQDIGEELRDLAISR